jgi:hypothetical protein
VPSVTIWQLDHWLGNTLFVWHPNWLTLFSQQSSLDRILHPLSTFICNPPLPRSFCFLVYLTVLSPGSTYTIVVLQHRLLVHNELERKRKESVGVWHLAWHNSIQSPWKLCSLHFLARLYVRCYLLEKGKVQQHSNKLSIGLKFGYLISKLMFLGFTTQQKRWLHIACLELL